ncbi:hypothetical protein DAI22_08g203800 [Oryza sativa Japonica Group]|nr:hypothetical protein DAI22_08g203800 [Oryza sativa Japonica Group]
MFQMLPPRLAFSTRFSCGGGGGGAVVVSGERLAVDARRNDPDECGLDTSVYDVKADAAKVAGGAK